MLNLNTQENTEPGQPEPMPKNKLVAALLSLCLLGGAGHVYLGQSKKGWLLISVSAMLSCTGLDFIVLIFGAIDAYYTAKKMERGQPIGKMEWFWQKTVTPAASEKGQDADTSGSDGQSEGGDKPAAETGDGATGGEDEPVVGVPDDSSGENGPGRVLITDLPIIDHQPAANGSSAPFIILSSQSTVDDAQRDGNTSPTVATHPGDISDKKGGGGSNIVLSSE